VVWEWSEGGCGYNSVSRKDGGVGKDELETRASWQPKKRSTATLQPERNNYCQTWEIWTRRGEVQRRLERALWISEQKEASGLCHCRRRLRLSNVGCPKKRQSRPWSCGGMLLGVVTETRTKSWEEEKEKGRRESSRRESCVRVPHAGLGYAQGSRIQSMQQRFRWCVMVPSLVK
jgi:hypothetical protein